MTAFNVVRFRVLPGQEDGFVELYREMKPEYPGMRRSTLVRTGDRSFCILGEWDDMSDIVAARPAMVARLDRMRGMLEDLGGGLGVTDPVAGEVVVDHSL